MCIFVYSYAIAKLSFIVYLQLTFGIPKKSSILIRKCLIKKKKTVSRNLKEGLYLGQIDLSKGAYN